MLSQESSSFNEEITNVHVFSRFNSIKYKDQLTS